MQSPHLETVIASLLSCTRTGEGEGSSGHLVRIACAELPWGEGAAVPRSRCLDAAVPQAPPLGSASPDEAPLSLSLLLSFSSCTQTWHASGTRPRGSPSVRTCASAAPFPQACAVLCSCARDPSLSRQVEWRELTSAVPVALAVNAKRGLARCLSRFPIAAACLPF